VGGQVPGDAGAPAGPSVGRRIAGYRLEERVGAGRMAVVFRAVDERLGRQVALKVIAAVMASDDAARYRFLRNSKAVTAAVDPHLLPIYEIGESGGVLFIAMRYVGGGDLHSLVRREGPLSAERAAAIISPVASALDAVHAAGVWHGDVKPASILLDVTAGRPDHVYLADLGNPREQSAPRLTAAGHLEGNADHAAPELFAGAAVDGRADQYALACTAFEVLSGERPFRRDEPAALIWAVMNEPPPLLTSRRPDLPPAVNGVLAKALAKKPGDRYATCRDFADALRKALVL
jgi:serine/threonine protein kinase